MTTLLRDCEPNELCPSCALSEPRYDKAASMRLVTTKIGIIIDLDRLRSRMAQFVAEVSPHDPLGYTVPFETYLQWEMRQRQENVDDKHGN